MDFEGTATAVAYYDDEETFFKVEYEDGDGEEFTLEELDIHRIDPRH